jgi:hypothetical protein
MKIHPTRRKAIGEILGALIVIAIVVAAGLILYTLFTSTASNVGSQTVVSVQSNKLVVALPGGSAVWAITLKDSSSKPITSLTATINGAGIPSTVSTVITPSYSGATVSSNNQLLPGTSASGSITISTGITLGQTYTVTITAQFSDGSSQTFTTSVTATSS